HATGRSARRLSAVVFAARHQDQYGTLGFPPDQEPAIGPVRWPNLATDRRRRRDRFLGCQKVVAFPTPCYLLKKGITMAETTKLSVEKALNKLGSTDPPKSKTERIDEKIDELEKETERMRAQRLRLERHQRRPAKR